MARILLIEDNQGDIDLIVTSCTNVAPELTFTVVTTAVQCQDVLARNRSTPFDAMLLDYTLPDRDGLHLLSDIVHAGIKTPVIMITGRNDVQTAVEAMKAGAVDYLVKTNGYWEHLPRVLQSTVERHRLMRENQRLHHEITLRATELEQAMRQTAREQHRLRTVLDQLPEGVLIVDGPDGQTITANSAALRLWGQPFLTDVPAVEQWCSQARRLDGTAYLPEETIIERVVQTGKPILGEQEVIVQPQGRQLTVLINAAPLRDVHQEVNGAVIVFQDISEIKRLEHLKDEILSIASHELKNPLTVIMGYSSLLSRLLSDENPRAQRAATTIRQQSQRMRWLVERLLDLSRLDLGRMTLQRTPFDLARLLHHIAEQQQETTQKHNLCVQVEHAPLVIEGDATRMEQVLMNLVNNAIKYSPDGGDVVLSMDITDRATLLDTVVNDGTMLADSGPYVLIQVQDQGIGIDSQVRQNLFTRLYRASEATHIASGQGLGLYISAEILRMHGGAMFVESIPGQGSTFSVVLPLGPPASGA